MSNIIKRRSECRLCRGTELSHVLHLAPTPIAEKYHNVKSKERLQNLFPLDLYMCGMCGHVQMLDVIDPEFMFDDYTYFTSKSRIMVKHFKEYVDYVMDNYGDNLSSGALVIDIGSNDGTLLSFFREEGMQVLGIDPATKAAKKAIDLGINTIVEFVDEELSKGIRIKYGAAKIVTANNAFAHSDDLTEILLSVKHLLDSDGIFVFEVSYLMDIVDKVLLGTIFHEHLSYHSLMPLADFLENNGFDLIEVKRVDIQGGSLIGIAQLKGGSHLKHESVDALINLEKEKELNKPSGVKVLSEKINAIKLELIDILNKIKDSGSRIAGYGAARSGATLIAEIGLFPYLDYIVDDDLDKHYKYTPGDQIQVLPVDNIYSDPPDYLFILAWIHAKDIVSNNIEFMRKGGKFIVCFPSVKIIDVMNYDKL